MYWISTRWTALSLIVTSVIVAGCGDSSPPTKTAPAVQKRSEKASKQARAQTDRASDDSAKDAEEPSAPPLAPIKLGGSTASTSSAESKPKRSADQQYDGVKSALKTVQVLIGQWHGIADKTASGTKSYDEFNWIWDVRTDKAQPALTMKSENSPHLKSARLTYLIDEQQYQLTIIDKEDRTRELRGTFTEDPAFTPGEDKKQTPQRTYKLLLTEAGDTKGRWQVILNQRENNRYLLELSRSQGTKFVRFDTVGNQREGTSFALNDSDYKEKTCVISQGLGTIAVNHKGKTYWVCCSGCKAAFEEDPDKWIAKFEAMQPEK